MDKSPLSTWSRWSRLTTFVPTRNAHVLNRITHAGRSMTRNWNCRFEELLLTKKKPHRTIECSPQDGIIRVIVMSTETFHQNWNAALPAAISRDLERWLLRSVERIQSFLWRSTRRLDLAQPPWQLQAVRRSRAFFNVHTFTPRCYGPNISYRIVSTCGHSHSTYKLRFIWCSGCSRSVPYKICLQSNILARQLNWIHHPRTSNP